MNDQVLHIIKNNPSKIISAFDLIYTTPDILRISRKKSQLQLNIF